MSFECSNCFNLIFKVEIAMSIAIRSLYWVLPLLVNFRTSTVPFSTSNSMISLVSSRLSPFHVAVQVIVSQRTQREEEEEKIESRIDP